MLDLEEILAEERLLILHSGEIPEIAYHSSLLYLSEDEDGPKLNLKEIDLTPLKEAVFERYKKIMLRDLNPRNRDKSIYRGVARSYVNWQRLKRFAQKEGLDISLARKEAAEALSNFLYNEVEEVGSGARNSSINCSYEEVVQFWKELGLPADELPKGLKKICEESK